MFLCICKGLSIFEEVYFIESDKERGFGCELLYAGNFLCLGEGVCGIHEP